MRPPRDTLTFPAGTTWRALACAAALAPLVTAQNAETVDNARMLLQQRFETRRILSKEKADWALGKEILTDRIGMAKRETASLREKTAEADANITEADVKRAELVAKNDALKQAADSLVAPIAALEQRTLALIKRLPPPLQDHLRAASQRIPQDPAQAEQRLGARFGTVAVILQDIDKWNGTITVAPELIDMGDGIKAEVTSIYLGIGQGYYVSADGKRAGVGGPAAEGWGWTPANDAAERIQQAIDIYRKKETAAFVRLPVRIQ